MRGLVLAGSRIQGSHAVTELLDIGEDLVVLSHRSQYLQPLDLDLELGPGSKALRYLWEGAVNGHETAAWRRGV
jgi:hypothetical protein